ncbi:MAG: hypothetical protein AB7P97_20335 [Hyphomonadaceae bacterium]
MTGTRSQLGYVATMVRRAMNGEGRSARIATGAAQQSVTPSTTAVSTASAPNLANDVVMLRAPIPHLSPTTLRPAAPSPGVIRPGPNATPGAATASGSSYGPTTYYGAPEGAAETATATATEKKGGLLPIGLLLWALFGT